jgi:hypothetical protein
LAIETHDSWHRHDHKTKLPDDRLRIVTANQDFSPAGRMKNIRAAQMLAARIHEDGARRR